MRRDLAQDANAARGACHVRVRCRANNTLSVPESYSSIAASPRPLGRALIAFSNRRRSPRSCPISDGTLNAALSRLGYAKDEAIGHGFRATASGLPNESGKWHPDAIERQLAHIVGNSARAAYSRLEHCGERVSTMQWWADYLDQAPASAVALGKMVV